MLIVVIQEPGIREIVNGIFDDYIMDAFNSVDVVLSIAQHIARIGIAIMILSVFLKESRRADIFAYLKWVPLGFLFVNYKVFALAIFEFYSNIGIALQANDMSWDMISTKLIAAQALSFENLSELSLLDLTWNDIEAAIMLNMTSTLLYLGMAASTVVFIGVKAISVIYLFVLIVFGPINIGLSFIPALSGMWKAWLQKFMSVCLWIPMLLLIDNFLLGVIDKIIDNIIIEEEVNSGIVLVGCLLIFMNLFIYLKAPTLANFVVQGMNVSANQIKDKPKHYAKKAGNVVLATKTGGTSKIAQIGTKILQ